MTKAELRKIYIAKLKALRTEERAEKSKKIADSFYESFDLSHVRYLHTFIPIERFNEINTRLIIERIWRDLPSVQVVVPRIDYEKDEIESLKFDRDTVLAKNAWQIDEPAHDEFVDSELIDIVLVPGVYFDPSGHRVGYGKGYYDRFLAKCRPDCLKIGLSYWEPADVIGDVHDGDVRVNALVTPAGIANF